MELTHGTLLNGRVRYSQARDGYRSGIEPVLLAAACPARPGERVLELGTGAGAALLCLAARVPEVTGLGVELDPATAAIARCNMADNGWTRIEVRYGEVSAGVTGPPFDHAMANPPWHDPAATPAPGDERRRAKQRAPGLIATWAAMAAGALRPRGTLTLIIPAALLAETLIALAEAGLGAPALFPLWPREGAAARLVLMQASRGARGPARMLPGGTLHMERGWTGWADSVLREAAPILMG